jgi:cytochrome oxidase Cu insertion factor (SCO1/SenC/PrrC family)
MIRLNVRSYLSAATVAILMVALQACTPSTQDAVEQQEQVRDTLPVYRVVAPFTAVDQRGAVFTSTSLTGKYWLGSFFFTRCQTVCPALNRVKSRIQREFGTKLSFVSMSSDPEFDTPEVLAAYAQEYAQEGGAWWFVRMPKDSMLAVASQGFGLISPAEPEMHSTRFVLVDPAMQVRGFYDSEDTAAVAKLRADLKGLGL